MHTKTDAFSRASCLHMLVIESIALNFDYLIIDNNYSTHFPFFLFLFLFSSNVNFIDWLATTVADHYHSRYFKNDVFRLTF